MSSSTEGEKEKGSTDLNRLAINMAVAMEMLHVPPNVRFPPMLAAHTTLLAPTVTWSPMVMGKKAMFPWRPRGWAANFHLSHPFSISESSHFLRNKTCGFPLATSGEVLAVILHKQLLPFIVVWSCFLRTGHGGGKQFAQGNQTSTLWAWNS